MYGNFGWPVTGSVDWKNIKERGKVTYIAIDSFGFSGPAFSDRKRTGIEKLSGMGRPIYRVSLYALYSVK